MSEDLKCNRRQFICAGAMTIAAARLGAIPTAEAESIMIKTARINSPTNTSFDPLKQIDAVS